MRSLELLSPARNKDVALAAINNGADAVYIGGPAFGARQAAGNTVDDIRRVVEYAHRFYCRVFVTLNTILYDEELLAAEKLAKELHAAGVDALIVQDPALLKLDLPPIALHASTQMHNYELERVRFLDRLGFQRIVLARELSLEQIREIRREVNAELEFFVHGALCVSLSGQCYMSHYLTGRSANRGECAQACRMRWTVEDDAGQVVVKNKHVLSLKDLNLSARLVELADAGIDSFKIEGRLKETSYVANVTRYYSALLDEAMACRKEWTRLGSGSVQSGFEPDPERSFNRGYTEYFITGRRRGLVNMDTPKSMGKRVGYVVRAKGNKLCVNVTDPIHNADGLCYLEKGELKGIKVNRAEGNLLLCNGHVKVAPGTVLYRNYDREFTVRLEKGVSVRKISVYLEARSEGGHFLLTGTDEDGVRATVKSEEVFEPAREPRQRGKICEQLCKFGNTVFCCKGVEYQGEEILFMPMSAVNAYRREWIEELTRQRERRRVQLKQGPLNRETVYPGVPDWRLNVVNRLSEEFYREHGTVVPEWGFEVSREHRGKAVMTTRYCLLHELGMCRKTGRDKALKFPLFLSNNLGRFRLDFDCRNCFMKVIALK